MEEVFEPPILAELLSELEATGGKLLLFLGNKNALFSSEGTIIFAMFPK